MEKATLKVGGMSCGHCVKAVQQALATVDGATAEQVAIGSATVVFDPGPHEHRGADRGGVRGRL